MKTGNKTWGNYGEGLAEAFLKEKGYRIVEKNFKNKIGEIDIIAKDGDVVCFVEVKSRRSLSCGLPSESVHYFKQRKLVRLAQSYLQSCFGTADVMSRFDVVCVYRNAGGSDEIEHIVNAFE